MKKEKEENNRLTAHSICIGTYILVLFFLNVNNANCQTSDYNKIVRNYLIEQNEINENSRVTTYAIEVLKLNKIEEEDDCGIYKIGAFTDHGWIYLLLIDKVTNEMIFLNLIDIEDSMKTVLNFLDHASCKFTDRIKISYIMKILKIYRVNTEEDN